MKKKLISIILILTSSALIAGPEELVEGELRFQLEGRELNFQNAEAVIISKGDKRRIIIGLRDSSQRMELSIHANVNKGEEFQPLVLSTTYNNLMFMFKSSEHRVAIMQHRRLVRGSALKHRTHETKNGRRVVSFKKPKWVRMSKRQRLQKGKGLAVNKRMRGTIFVLQLQPVKRGGKVVKYIGSFSGMARDHGRNIKIKSGEFKVAVETK